MDNQKDQSGTTPDQTNASRNPNASAAAASASGASSRKSASSPSASDTTPNPTAQSTAATPNAEAHTNAGTDRQGEGEQTNTPASALLDTALSSGKKWIEDSGVLNNVNQLPQSIKDLGARALDRVNGLSTTQKVVGGAILAAGLGWLATRKGKSSSGSSESSAYNYGRQRDAGSYGRKNYGYQAPDASTSRSDSGSAYGNSGSRFGSYNTEANSANNAGIKSGSGRDDSGAAYGHASAHTDHGTQSPSSGSDYRSVE